MPNKLFFLLITKLNIPCNKMGKNYCQKGFALIQTIVAIVILTFALSGTVALMGTIIKETALNKNRITAIYLAQECLELTRNVRDSAWKQNMPWLCAFGNPNNLSQSQYRIWTDETALPNDNLPLNCQNQLGTKIDSPLGKPFELVLKNNKFMHSDQINNETTIFQRKLTFSNIEQNNNEIEKVTATCEVTWPENKKIGQIKISEVLSNWKKQ